MSAFEKGQVKQAAKDAGKGTVLMVNRVVSGVFYGAALACAAVAMGTNKLAAKIVADKREENE